MIEMDTVFILYEEYEFKGVYSSLENAIEQRKKLKGRGLIDCCKIDEFVRDKLSLDHYLLYPGEEPTFRTWKKQRSD